MSSPVRETRMIYNDDPVGYSNRILCGTPTRGTVRIEWHSAFRGMVTPTNWSMVSMNQPMSVFLPVRFQVADAQNIIVLEMLKGDFEWLLLLEDDVIPPPDLLIKLNQYMATGKHPVVSGLYFTKSEPAEPLIYRGRGSGAFSDFRVGDPVMADGVPTGCLLIHHSILKAMWDDCDVYQVSGIATRRIFDSATDVSFDADGNTSTKACTSDLDWCWRVIDGGYLAKAGWRDIQQSKYPFLVDTSIQCKHITPDGRMFPGTFVTVPEDLQSPPDLGVSVAEDTALAEKLN